MGGFLWVWSDLGAPLWYPWAPFGHPWAPLGPTWGSFSLLLTTLGRALDPFGNFRATNMKKIQNESSEIKNNKTKSVKAPPVFGWGFLFS